MRPQRCSGYCYGMHKERAPSRAVTVLVVDDDSEIRTLLRAGLAREGFEVFEAANVRESLDCLELRPIDLITLDLSLGADDGLALARTIRGVRNVPIVMITAKGDVIDRIVGLELGADDYVVKPFHMRELIARLRAVLRRYEASNPVSKTTEQQASHYEFRSWILDLSKRELSNPAGELCPLTTAEFDLLSILVRRPSRVFTRNDIMDQLKGHDWAPLDRTIDGLIARLRKKIEPDEEVPRIFKTVRGVGYVFACDVRRV